MSMFTVPTPRVNPSFTSAHTTPITSILAPATISRFSTRSTNGLVTLPTPSEAEDALADRLAHAADDNDPDGYYPGWDGDRADYWAAVNADLDACPTYSPSPVLEAQWLGYTLGADGVEAEYESPDEEERAAFASGHNAGDDHLWRLDPLFAAHLKERAEKFAELATAPPL